MLQVQDNMPIIALSALKSKNHARRRAACVRALWYNRCTQRCRGAERDGALRGGFTVWTW
ncbi:MAG: hypothetical protein B6D41_13035 [Chloroflexi bacterium UTCFX4]|nr:MAG: hypothetical protein B6D41_13035 [Chloroflexi bacterium UTCFX4]